MKIATGVAIGRYYFSGEVQEIEPSQLAKWLMEQGGTQPLIPINEDDIIDDEELGYIDKAKAWWADAPPDTAEQAALEEGEEPPPQLSFLEKVGKKATELASSLGTEKKRVDKATMDQEIQIEIDEEALDKGEDGGAQEETAIAAEPEAQPEPQPGFLGKAKLWWNTPTQQVDTNEQEVEEEVNEVVIIPNEGPIQLVDVRTEYEFTSGHIPGANWVSFIPPWSLKNRLRRLGLDKDAVIVPICWTAHRSIMCCKVLDELGYKTKHLKGGMVAWRNDELQLPEVMGAAPDGGDLIQEETKVGEPQVGDLMSFGAAGGEIATCSEEEVLEEKVAGETQPTTAADK